MSEVGYTGSDGQKVKPTRLTDAVEKVGSFWIVMGF
jgi:hypothetical protein